MGSICEVNKLTKLPFKAGPTCGTSAMPAAPTCSHSIRLPSSFPKFGMVFLPTGDCATCRNAFRRVKPGEAPNASLHEGERATSVRYSADSTMWPSTFFWSRDLRWLSAFLAFFGAIDFGRPRGRLSPPPFCFFAWSRSRLFPCKLRGSRYLTGLPLPLPLPPLEKDGQESSAEQARSIKLRPRLLTGMPLPPLDRHDSAVLDRSSASSPASPSSEAGRRLRTRGLESGGEVCCTFAKISEKDGEESSSESSSEKFKSPGSKGVDCDEAETRGGGDAYEAD